MFRFLALFLICAAAPAAAQTLEDARQQLTGTLEEIQDSGRKQKELEKKREALEDEMKSLQEQTVGLAQDTQEQEKTLTALEEKNAILEDQKKDRLAALEARKAELAEMLSAMVRLSRMPPEAVIAMPGKIDETLSAARALKVITQTMEEESASLKAQLRELEELGQKIGKNRDDLVQKKSTLGSRQKQLAAKIRERTRLHEALGGKAQEEKERQGKLTKKSKTLQDLVDMLGHEDRPTPREEREAIAHGMRRQITASGKPGKGRSFAQSRGKLGLPVSGKIVGLYGHSEGGAAFSKGLMIEARGSNVVTPFDGQVVYAGVFRDYGKMVIIRHNGDYHTLLSGMQEINCAPGQSLLEGEPVGSMGEGGGGKKPRLYVEMRKSGKPIDPLGWFKG